MSMSGAVDWGVADKTGRRLVPAGPALSGSEIADVVASLREAADRAAPLISEVTHLTAGADNRVLIVDRPTWLTANLTAARVLVDAVGGNAAPGVTSTPANGMTSLRRRAESLMLGTQLGAALAWLATKVLGQFDPFAPAQHLLLVAPNVVIAERALRVHPGHFRLWVCLHEQTHRFQFARAPWLREHLLGLAGGLLSDPQPADEGAQAPKRCWAFREGVPATLLDLLVTPEQRAIVEQMIGVMSLLEGYADVMMDRVGPEVIPTVADIRAAFSARRHRTGLDAVLRAVLGLELKLAQYRDGARFCEQVIAAVGVDGLNTAFTGPAWLPSRSEVMAPDTWLRRVDARSHA